MPQKIYLRQLWLLLSWLITIWLTAACISSTATDTSVPATLFIPDHELPKGWVTPNHLRPMGPATLGFGDAEDDRYINFTLVDNKERLAIASEYIWHFKNSKQASDWYHDYFPTAYAFTTPETTKKLTGADGLNFQSKRATQYFVGCRVLYEGTYTCTFIALYDSFGVEFSSRVSPNVLSIAEYNRLLHVIDHIFIEYLK